MNKIDILEARRFLCNMQKQRDHPLPDVLVATGTSQIMPLNKLYHLFVTVPPFHHFCHCFFYYFLGFVMAAVAVVSNDDHDEEQTYDPS